MKKFLKTDEWNIIEDSFQADRMRWSESIFSLGNGRFGQRGYFEEPYSSDSYRGTFVAGITFLDKTRVNWWKNGFPQFYTRIPNAPEWSRISLRLIDEELDLAQWDVDSFNRRLDMKAGISYRDVEVTSPRGNKLRLHVEHIADMARPNLCLIKYSVTHINTDTLVALTNKVLEIMHRDNDLINVRNSWGNKVPIWKPIYSQERAQPLGVSRQSMAQSIQIGTSGMTLGEYRQGDQVLPILLKDNAIDSFRINDLRTLPVFGTTRETTTLEQVVSDFDYQYKFSNVKDYNRQMVMMAQADPRRGVNSIAAFNRVWKQVQKEIDVPEGYTMKYFGEQESQAESNAALAANMPLTFFLMFVTLLFLFKSYRKPIVILLMLPLIFIGIVLGLLLLGKTFDFFAILGLLGLIGMNIKNAIVLVDQIDAETAMGKTPREAVISATTTRIVPVAMASGTTILGMLPLLFDAMFGGMAATIMGGLLVASILTLFVLPVAYCAIHKIKG